MLQISLKAARTNANMTQDDVAKNKKKSKQTIVNWESGKTIIDAANFACLCKLYRIDPKYIALPYQST